MPGRSQGHSTLLDGAHGSQSEGKHTLAWWFHVCSLALNGSAILPKSSRLGKVVTPKHLTVPWGRHKNLPSRSGVGVDAIWNLARVPRSLSNSLQAEIGEGIPCRAASIT